MDINEANKNVTGNGTTHKQANGRYKESKRGSQQGRQPCQQSYQSTQYTGGHEQWTPNRYKRGHTMNNRDTFENTRVVKGDHNDMVHAYPSARPQSRASETRHQQYNNTSQNRFASVGANSLNQPAISNTPGYHSNTQPGGTPRRNTFDRKPIHQTPPSEQHRSAKNSSYFAPTQNISHQSKLDATAPANKFQEFVNLFMQHANQTSPTNVQTIPTPNNCFPYEHGNANSTRFQNAMRGPPYVHGPTNRFRNTHPHNHQTTMFSGQKPSQRYQSPSNQFMRPGKSIHRKEFTPSNKSSFAICGKQPNPSNLPRQRVPHNQHIPLNHPLPPNHSSVQDQSTKTLQSMPNNHQTDVSASTTLSNNASPLDNVPTQPAMIIHQTYTSTVSDQSVVSVRTTETVYTTSHTKGLIQSLMCSQSTIKPMSKPESQISSTATVSRQPGRNLQQQQQNQCKSNPEIPYATAQQIAQQDTQQQYETSLHTPFDRVHELYQDLQSHQHEANPQKPSDTTRELAQQYPQQDPHRQYPHQYPQQYPQHPQQQYPQYPQYPQQYPQYPQLQYSQLQYLQQYPPQQYPPQQYPPQQYPPQQYPPQQYSQQYRQQYPEQDPPQQYPQHYPEQDPQQQYEANPRMDYATGQRFSPREEREETRGASYAAVNTMSRPYPKTTVPSPNIQNNPDGIAWKPELQDNDALVPNPFPKDDFITYPKLSFSQISGFQQPYLQQNTMQSLQDSHLQQQYDDISVTSSQDFQPTQHSLTESGYVSQLNKLNTDDPPFPMPLVQSQSTLYSAEPSLFIAPQVHSDAIPVPGYQSLDTVDGTHVVNMPDSNTAHMPYPDPQIPSHDQETPQIEDTYSRDFPIQTVRSLWNPRNYIRPNQRLTNVGSQSLNLRGLHTFSSPKYPMNLGNANSHPLSPWITRNRNRLNGVSSQSMLHQPENHYSDNHNHFRGRLIEEMATNTNDSDYNHREYYPGNCETITGNGHGFTSQNNAVFESDNKRLTSVNEESNSLDLPLGRWRVLMQRQQSRTPPFPAEELDGEVFGEEYKQDDTLIDQTEHLNSEQKDQDLQSFLYSCLSRGYRTPLLLRYPPLRKLMAPVQNYWDAPENCETQEPIIENDNENKVTIPAMDNTTIRNNEFGACVDHMQVEEKHVNFNGNLNVFEQLRLSDANKNSTSISSTGERHGVYELAIIEQEHLSSFGAVGSSVYSTGVYTNAITSLSALDIVDTDKTLGPYSLAKNDQSRFVSKSPGVIGSVAFSAAVGSSVKIPLPTNSSVGADQEQTNQVLRHNVPYQFWDGHFSKVHMNSVDERDTRSRMGNDGRHQLNTHRSNMRVKDSIIVPLVQNTQHSDVTLSGLNIDDTEGVDEPTDISRYIQDMLMANERVQKWINKSFFPAIECNQPRTHDHNIAIQHTQKQTISSDLESSNINCTITQQYEPGIDISILDNLESSVTDVIGNTTCTNESLIDRFVFHPPFRMKLADLSNTRNDVVNSTSPNASHSDNFHRSPTSMLRISGQKYSNNPSNVNGSDITNDTTHSTSNGTHFRQQASTQRKGSHNTGILAISNSGPDRNSETQSKLESECKVDSTKRINSEQERKPSQHDSIQYPPNSEKGIRYLTTPCVDQKQKSDRGKQKIKSTDNSLNMKNIKLICQEMPVQKAKSYWAKRVYKNRNELFDPSQSYQIKPRPGNSSSSATLDPCDYNVSSSKQGKTEQTPPVSRPKRRQKQTDQNFPIISNGGHSPTSVDKYHHQRPKVSDLLKNSAMRFSRISGKTASNVAQANNKEPARVTILQRNPKSQNISQNESLDNSGELCGNGGITQRKDEQSNRKDVKSGTGAIFAKTGVVRHGTVDKFFSPEQMSQRTPMGMMGVECVAESVDSLTEQKNDGMTNSDTHDGERNNDEAKSR